jgi:hypothetical protein
MKTVGTGNYSLQKLVSGHKLLTLDKKSYIWVSGNPGHLVRTKETTKGSILISKGRYWLFDVATRPGLTKGLHLSIVKSPGEWEAFIITDGLPDKVNKQSIITPTDERIAWKRERPTISLLL